jgi:hypothetical protein
MPCRRQGGKENSSYPFSTSALDGVERSASRLGRALAPVSIVQQINIILGCNTEQSMRKASY